MVIEWISHLGLCPIRNLTGLPCPGCGMTRALLSLVKLDAANAVKYHPLVWLVPLIALIFIFRNHVPFFNKLTKSKGVCWTIIGIFLVTYGWRMIQLFPHGVPLDFNEQGLIPLIWQKITT